MVDCGGVYILPLTDYLYYPVVGLPSLRNLVSDSSYAYPFDDLTYVIQSFVLICALT